MKIENSHSVNGANSVKRKKTTGASGSSFSGFLEETSSGAGISGTTGLLAMTPFMPLEEVTQDDPEATRKAKQRGEGLLDSLDDLRIGLLSGSIPETTLHQLEGKIKAERASLQDPKLMAVLDEIEVRAAVELAKLEKAAG